MQETNSKNFDVIIIGAGAAGMFCAIEAGKRRRSVLLLDHAKKAGEKIRISGGGRCNFTNIYAAPENYLSGNKHFCKSALRQYTQQDFIKLIQEHHIEYHEKTLGQLFCDGRATQIIEMLQNLCKEHNVETKMETQIIGLPEKREGLFHVKTNMGHFNAKALIIATGGLSIPKMGATDLGYRIAKQFKIPVTETRAGLVPFTFASDFLAKTKPMAGLSINASVKVGKVTFDEGILFTHKGISGPAILQISSFWKEGQAVHINLAPEYQLDKELLNIKNQNSKQDISTILSQYLPKKLSQFILDEAHISGKMAEISNKNIAKLAQFIHQWEIKPNGTEGYRTAEVTLGGVDCNALSSKTMMAKEIDGLYFIGEVVDVTGHLGGYNFQWAWSSAYVAGQNC